MFHEPFFRVRGLSLPTVIKVRVNGHEEVVYQNKPEASGGEKSYD